MPGRQALIALALLVALTGAATETRAQCMLANPSFEIAGSSGATFAGWSQFGTVLSSSSAPHGHKSALVVGPSTNAWDVAGVWQSLDCTPGQQWTATVLVEHPSSAPLTTGCQALLNIEWRDSGGNLISYESHTLADAGTPADTWRQVPVTSGTAPAGTASIHFLLGVLHAPGAAVPQVLFDSPTCDLVSPSLSSYQWGDFGGGRTISFSGRTWRVKGPGYYGPGPNSFDNGTGAVFLDANGRLHLTIHKIGAVWWSSEVALDQVLGYGDYVFTTRGHLETFDRNAVLGMFLWEYGPCYNTSYLWWNPYNEIDVEISRWGNAANANAQFVAQPAGTGAVSRFNVAAGDTELVSHAMRWLPDRVEYRCWRGGPSAESAANMIASWTYTGPYLPRPEIPRVHLNFWQLAAPTVTQEAVFESFVFRSACPSENCGALAADPLPVRTGLRLLASPNPAASRSWIRFSVPVSGPARVAVYDVTGRHVRTLWDRTAESGEHAVEWDARGESGARVAAGVYLVRLQAAGATATARMVVVR